LACHADGRCPYDGRKKTALGAAVRLLHRETNLASRFLRDGRTVPEAVLFVKRLIVARHIRCLYTAIKPRVVLDVSREGESSIRQRGASS